MADLTIFCPTRGRPQNARELQDIFYNTSTADSELIFIVDHDDPSLSEYMDLERDVFQFYHWCITESTRRGMTQGLNRAFDSYSLVLGRAVGFFGDDHRPRTVGWDSAYLAAIEAMGGTGMVYGNDLLQGERLPTQIVMSTSIPMALGRMVPDELQHLYVDDYWLALGRQLGRIRYLDDVVIEHLHYSIGKAEEDEGYRVVNSSEMAQRDRVAWQQFKTSGGLRRDVRRVKRALGL